MPLEEVEIELSEMDPYQAGALYFAVIAYPDRADTQRRADYQQALIRWTLHKRISIDPKWANGLQLVRPGYFSGPDTQHEKMLREGNKRLHRSKLIAEHVVLPHLRKFDTGRVHKVEGGLPTFERTLVLATKALGLAENSFATVANRYWKPLKPVAHALCAYMVWADILWKNWGRKPKVDRQLAFMMLPEYVAEVAEIAEHFRAQVGAIKEFEIKEENTIRITTRIADLDSAEEGIANNSPPSGAP